MAEVFALRPVNNILDHLTDLVTGGSVTFANDVIADMRQSYDGDHSLTWTVAVKASLFEPAVPWTEKQDVQDAYPELVDPNTARETCLPAVLAQARRLGSPSTPCCIVTEDFGEKPGRMSLAAACAAEGIRCISAADFLDEVGL
ncbi:hypothetical protein DVA67_030860 [Solirubrobacter sp. CPCC 204708]|nr:hypothetical protein [Solirubrobacter deserti]